MWRVDPHTVHKHMCRHGKISTHDSSFPQCLQNLPLLSPIIIFPKPPSFLSFTPAHPDIIVRHPTSFFLSPSSPVLPQQDWASSINAAAAPSSTISRCANTCSRLHRKAFAVASFVWAKSRQIWFSIHRDFTFSSNAQLSFPIFSISSSFAFSFFITPASIASIILLACLFRFWSISILTFSIWRNTSYIADQYFKFKQVQVNQKQIHEIMTKKWNILVALLNARCQAAAVGSEEKRLGRETRTSRCSCNSPWSAFSTREEQQRCCCWLNHFQIWRRFRSNCTPMKEARLPWRHRITENTKNNQSVERYTCWHSHPQNSSLRCTTT